MICKYFLDNIFKRLFLRTIKWLHFTHLNLIRIVPFTPNHLLALVYMDIHK